MGITVMRHYNFILCLMAFCLPVLAQEDATAVSEPEETNESVVAEQNAEESVATSQEAPASDKEEVASEAVKEAAEEEEEVQEVEIENTESEASPAVVSKALFRTKAHGKKGASFLLGGFLTYVTSARILFRTNTAIGRKKGLVSYWVSFLTGARLLFRTIGEKSG